MAIPPFSPLQALIEGIEIVEPGFFEPSPIMPRATRFEGPRPPSYSGWESDLMTEEDEEPEEEMDDWTPRAPSPFRPRFLFSENDPIVANLGTGTAFDPYVVDTPNTAATEPETPEGEETVSSQWYENVEDDLDSTIRSLLSCVDALHDARGYCLGNWSDDKAKRYAVTKKIYECIRETDGISARLLDLQRESSGVWPYNHLRELYDDKDIIRGHPTFSVI